MKKTNKIIVALSMVMIALSITSLCFSIAWYNAYPGFHNISLQTGKESLEIHNRVFLRTRTQNTQTQKYNNVFQETNNIKVVNGETHSVNAGGGTVDTSTGKVIVNFTDLSYSLFGITSADTDIKNGGLLDPDTMTWDTSYLTFAVLECTFYNQYFPAYLKAFDTTTITLNNAAYTGNLFSIRYVHETTDNGQNSSMFGLINDPTNNTQLQKDNLSKVNDNILLVDNDVTFKSINPNVKTPVSFPIPGAAPSDPVTYTLEKKIIPHGASSSTIAAEGTPYSYAFAVALSINPIELFKLVTSDAGFNPNQTFSITLTLDFEASNVGGGI